MYRHDPITWCSDIETTCHTGAAINWRVRQRGVSSVWSRNKMTGAIETYSGANPLITTLTTGQKLGPGPNLAR